MKIRNALLTICLFCLAILISACGRGGKSTPPSYPIIPPQPVPEIHELQLSQDIFEINIGQTDNITVTLDKGIITALGQGSTDVVVSLEGANNAIFTVNVDLPTLELSKPQFDLGIGDTDNVTVTLNGQDVTEENCKTIRHNKKSS